MNGYFSHKVKSIWAVFLALIASMLVLSGCGGTSDGASSAANRIAAFVRNVISLAFVAAKLTDSRGYA